MFKHLHMTLAVISVALFTLRFIWLLLNSDKLNRKWVKISPHIVDTLLLGLGTAMAIKLAISPLEYMWLAEKLLAVIAYIFTGYYTLKVARNRAMQIFGYLGAMGWIILVGRLAITKQPIFFL